MSLKNKCVLITAGPTWVPIDNVRVISNIATGETGILLAEKLQNLGAKVTLLLGPAENPCLNKKIRVVRFRFFNELRNIIKRELQAKRYDVIVHSAAVSDFGPKMRFRGKLDSGKPHNIELISLPKIISDIRSFAPSAKIVMFKLESGVSDTILIRRAKAALVKANADFTVANSIEPYRTFVIDRVSNIVTVKNKKELAEKLPKILNLIPITEHREPKTDNRTPRT